MNQKEVINLSAFRQVQPDGSAFISCQGEVEGLGVVEFTCDEESIYPISTGNLIPLEGKADRSLVQLKRTCGFALVEPKRNEKKEVRVINGVDVTPVVFSRLVQILAAPVPKVVWGQAAARKPAAQAAAEGAIA